MFGIEVTNDLIGYSQKRLWEKRFENRGYADGTDEQRIVGMTGENAIRKKLGFPPNLFNAPDGGVDLTIFGVTIDIKTMGRMSDPKAGYVNNFLACQSRVADAYLFASFNKRTQVLTVCGWMTSMEFVSHAVLYKAGEERVRDDGTKFELKGDTYEVENKDLRQVESAEDLLAQIMSLGKYRRAA